MFKQINRLTKDKDFDNVFKNGHSSYNKAIGIKAFKNSLTEPRVGILVNTKVSKKAVERNQIKRRIREIFKESLEKIKTPHDIVVITMPPVKKLNYKEIEKIINFNLKKLKLID